jgi:heme iron utilization protein
MPRLGHCILISKSSGESIHVPAPVTPEISAEVRALIAAASSASLATLDRQSGGPYVSLVSVATASNNAPILLLSGLAQHTKNIAVNPRASLLLAVPQSIADPLTLGRVTLTGRIEHSDDPATRAAFLQRHPAASQYADFADFAFYRFVVAEAHFVGGFGRIVKLMPADLSSLR